MNQPDEKIAEPTGANRREMVTGLLRAATLAGLAAMSGYLLTRGASGSSEGQCSRATRCGQCALSSSCRLPQREGER